MQQPKLRALKGRKHGVSYSKYGYIFCIPFVATFLLFSLYPIIYTLLISMSNMQGITSKWHILSNPFQNIGNILSNTLFLGSLKNTVILWVCNFIPQLVIAMLLAAWFTNTQLRIHGQGAFKILLFMPNIITASTIAILFNSLLSYPTGAINVFLQNAGLIEEPINFLRNVTVARGAISFIQFWMWYGNSMIVLIAGIMGINPALFEAASIDGANGFQTFIHVTLPNLRTIMLFTLVTSLIGGLQMFDIPKLFNNGNPDSSTKTVTFYIHEQAFEGSQQFSKAAAASMVLFALTAVLAGTLFYFMRDKEASRARKAEKLRKKIAKEDGTL